MTEALQLPDGTVLHWEQTGAGPTVLLANLLYGHPAMIGGLTSDLASDHRVITYDLRGTGRSSRHGPYDIAVDMADLEALLEQVGGAAVSVAIGDASLRAMRMAAARPDLLDVVVAPGTFVLAGALDRSSHGLSASPAVLKALTTLIERDYRAGVRSIVGGGNPNLTEDQIRERVDLVVDHCSQEAAVSRLGMWIRDDGTEPAVALGNRLWILNYPGNPWFPPEIAERMSEILPGARYEAVEDGPMSRPDLTAAIVRRVTGAAAPD